MDTVTNIEDIYNNYSQALYCTSLRITGNSFDAEEIMQDTIIKYYNFEEKDKIEKLKSWLTSICIRKSIDRLREKNKNKDFLEDYSQISNTPVEEDSKVELSVQKIKKALVLLPDNYRTIVSLHLFEGYDYDEISQITGLKQNTIRGQFLRGKDKLINIIKQIQ